MEGDDEARPELGRRDGAKVRATRIDEGVNELDVVALRVAPETVQQRQQLARRIAHAVDGAVIVTLLAIAKDSHPTRLVRIADLDAAAGLPAVDGHLGGMGRIEVAKIFGRVGVERGVIVGVLPCSKGRRSRDELVKRGQG